MRLIVTEKPSVADAICKAMGIRTKQKGYYENSEYVCTWALGHLLEIASPGKQNPAWDGEWREDQLPMMPERFRYELIPNKAAQFKVIKSLIQSGRFTEIINAGDDGREGELIQREIYQACGNTLPVLRLRISSLDNTTIRAGFKRLVDGKIMDNIYTAAKIRANEDWKLGMNFSRLICVKNRDMEGSPIKGFSLGRVQAVVVELVRKRNDEIAAFVPTPYYLIRADFDGYYGMLQGDDEKQKYFTTPQEADALIEKLQGNDGVVTGYEIKKRNLERPALFCLSALQTAANQKYGYSPAVTLQTAQALYEDHKIITYPRTDSDHLTENMRGIIPSLFNAIAKRYPLKDTPLVKGLTMDEHIFNDKKVSDHHAIIINENYQGYDISKLSQKEANILDLIVRRMMLAFSPKYEYNQTIVLTQVAGEIFRSAGETPLVEGWKRTAVVLGMKKSATPESQTFGHLKQGDQVKVMQYQREDKQTTPPKQYTTGTLIDMLTNIYKLFEGVDDKVYRKLMKDCKGIATEATRADIIDLVINTRHYIEESGKRKHLIVTEKGRALLSMTPEKLKDPVFSAEWEKAFIDIEKGRIKADDFAKEVDRFIIDTVNGYKGKQINITKEQLLNIKILGKCPKCGGAFIAGEKGAYCKNKCGFILKQYGSKILTETQIANLLDNKKVLLKGVKGRTKAGKDITFDAAICPTGKLKESSYKGKMYYYMEFETEYPCGKVLGTCPKCGKDFITGKYGAYCSGKCGFSLTKYGSKKLTDQQIMKLLQKKSVTLKGVKGKEKDGKEITYDVIITPSGSIREKTYEGKTYYFMEFDREFPKNESLL